MKEFGKIIKIGLAVVLTLCLLKMPYGYYELVRVLATVGFGILAFSSRQEGKESEMWVYVVLCLLFQPFSKVVLGRTLWNIIDVVVAIGLLISLKENRK